MEWSLTCHSDGEFRYTTDDVDGNFSGQVGEAAMEHVKALRDMLLEGHKGMILENKRWRLAQLEEQVAALKKELCPTS
jgi:hypothetical protein